MRISGLVIKGSCVTDDPRFRATTIVTRPLRALFDSAYVWLMCGFPVR